MINIKHSDGRYKEYFARLIDAVRTGAGGIAPRLGEARGRRPPFGAEGDKYLLVVPKGCQPKRSAQQISEVLLVLLNQPDWDEIVLDDTYNPNKDEVWETFGKGDDRYFLSLKSTNDDAGHSTANRVLLIRRRHSGDDSASFKRRGTLNVKLFTSCPEHSKTVLCRPLPFVYFVAAVVITFSFCYLLLLVTRRRRKK